MTVLRHLPACRIRPAKMRDQASADGFDTANIQFAAGGIFRNRTRVDEMLKDVRQRYDPA